MRQGAPERRLRGVLNLNFKGIGAVVNSGGNYSSIGVDVPRQRLLLSNVCVVFILDFKGLAVYQYPKAGTLSCDSMGDVLFELLNGLFQFR